MELSFDDAIHEPRENLLGLLGAVEVIGKAYGTVPAAESRAMAELASENALSGAWGGDPVSGAHTWAGMLVAGAAAQFQTLTRIVVGKPSVFGPQTLARSGLEMAARAFWLLEPDIGVRLRVARHKTEQLHSFMQARALLGETDYATHGEKAITATANELGFEVVRGKKERHSSIIERRPNATTAFRELLDGSGRTDIGPTIFGYLSAIDHGTVYALMSSLRTDDVRPVAGYPGIVQAALVMDSRHTGLLLSVATLGLANAANRHAALNGWDNRHWNSNFSNALRSSQHHLAADSS